MVVLIIEPTRVGAIRHAGPPGIHRRTGLEGRLIVVQNILAGERPAIESRFRGQKADHDRGITLSLSGRTFVHGARERATGGREP
jgi:hypothetical protein